MITDSTINKLTSILKDGIHIVDERGNTVVYNRKMSVIENRSLQDIQSTNLFERNDPKDEDIVSVLNSATPLVNKIYSGINKFGNKVIANNSIWPISQNSEVIGVIKVAVDVTEIRELHEKILGISKDIGILTKKSNISGEKRGYLLSDIIGESDIIKNVKKKAKLASESNANVLIYGASGTGKELFAQSIHNESKRYRKPLIMENCAAIPENLLESVLFGTVKGGFTGAIDRIGLFEMANGGTLILDEINSLPIGLQAKLLRVLQEGSFRPIGGTDVVDVDVRVIGIMNENPEQLIYEKKLREDLFYRLSVIDIYVPLLKERDTDVQLLMKYFLEKHSENNQKNLNGFSEEVLKAFDSYSWRGNVRELSNVIECGVSMAKNNSLIEMKDLPFYFMKYYSREQEKIMSENEIENALASGVTLQKYIACVEQEVIWRAFEMNNCNISKTAELLGVTRQTLQHKLKKLKI